MCFSERVFQCTWSYATSNMSPHFIIFTLLTNTIFVSSQPQPNFATINGGPIACGETKSGTLSQTGNNVTYEYTAVTRDPFTVVSFDSCATDTSMNPTFFEWTYKPGGSYTIGEIPCNAQSSSSACVACISGSNGAIFTFKSQYWNLGVGDQRWIQLAATTGSGPYSLTLTCQYTDSPTTAPTVTTTAPSTITQPPTTAMPTTYNPTTYAPTTYAPTQTPTVSTDNPTTYAPTTYAPTTNMPTTSIPTNFPTVFANTVSDKQGLGEGGKGGLLNSDNMLLVIIIISAVCFCLLIICLFVYVSRRQKTQNNGNKDVVQITVTTKDKHTDTTGTIQKTVTLDGNIDLRESSDDENGVNGNEKVNKEDKTSELMRLASNESMYSNEHEGNNDNIITTPNGNNIEEIKDNNVENELLDEEGDEESMYDNKHQTDGQLITKNADSDTDEEIYEQVSATKTGGDI
eukprot:125565_1